MSDSVDAVLSKKITQNTWALGVCAFVLFVWMIALLVTPAGRTANKASEPEAKHGTTQGNTGQTTTPQDQSASTSRPPSSTTLEALLLTARQHDEFTTRKLIDLLTDSAVAHNNTLFNAALKQKAGWSHGQPNDEDLQTFLRAILDAISEAHNETFSSAEELSQYQADLRHCAYELKVLLTTFAPTKPYERQLVFEVLRFTLAEREYAPALFQKATLTSNAPTGEQRNAIVTALKNHHRMLPDVNGAGSPSGAPCLLVMEKGQHNNSFTVYAAYDHDYLWPARIKIPQDQSFQPLLTALTQFSSTNTDNVKTSPFAEQAFHRTPGAFYFQPGFRFEAEGTHYIVFAMRTDQPFTGPNWNEASFTIATIWQYTRDPEGRAIDLEKKVWPNPAGNTQ